MNDETTGPHWAGEHEQLRLDAERLQGNTIECALAPDLAAEVIDGLVEVWDWLAGEDKRADNNWAELVRVRQEADERQEMLDIHRETAYEQRRRAEHAELELAAVRVRADTAEAERDRWQAEARGVGGYLAEASDILSTALGSPDVPLGSVTSISLALLAAEEVARLRGVLQQVQALCDMYGVGDDRGHYVPVNRLLATLSVSGSANPKEKP